MSIATINQLFGDEQSLDGVGEALSYSQVVCGYLSNQIVGRAGRQLDAHDFQGQIDAARDAWTLLQSSTLSTRSQVQSMTQEIQLLDHTKDNLVVSVTILKRLQMLTKLHSQLEGQLKERQYREISFVLPAALELAEHFRDFRTLAHVAHLSQLVADFQVKLNAQVFEELKRYCKGEQIEDLSWACRASANKSQLIEWYTQHSLKPYEQVFTLGSEAAGLDNIDRRFAMLRNLLNKHNDKAFPEEWHVGVELAKAACDKTRQDISVLQFGATSSSVQLLLNSLQQSTEFEGYLRRKFPEFAGDFASPISRSFTPHLQVWVEFHEHTLREMLQNYASHLWNEDVEGSDVFASSTDLFSYYRNAMDQMSKLSVGAPLVALSRVFSACLSQYAQLLRGYIPHGLDPEQLEVSQKTLRTATYCIGTTQQLETSIYNLVTPELQPEVDFSAPNDKFQGVIKACLESYITQVEESLKLSWREMANCNWQRLLQAGDESSYVRELTAILKKAMADTVESLTRVQHQRIVCETLVHSVTFSFLQVVMARVRPVSVVAAEQLLLDFYSIKGTFVQALDDSKYRERAVATCSRVEAVLKVLLTQPEPAESLVQNYLLLTKDGSLASFRKVLEAKGLRAPKYADLFASLSQANGQDLDKNLWPLSEIKMTMPRVASPPPPETKFSENFKRIGDFLRRDPSASPLLR